VPRDIAQVNLLW